MAPISEIQTHARMGNWVKFFEVPSESNPNGAYIVSADAEFQKLQVAIAKANAQGDRETSDVHIYPEGSLMDFGWYY